MAVHIDVRTVQAVIVVSTVVHTGIGNVARFVKAVGGVVQVDIRNFSKFTKAVSAVGCARRWQCGFQCACVCCALNGCVVVGTAQRCSAERCFSGVGL